MNPFPARKTFDHRPAGWSYRDREHAQLNRARSLAGSCAAAWGSPIGVVSIWTPAPMQRVAHDSPAGDRSEAAVPVLPQTAPAHAANRNAESQPVPHPVAVRYRELAMQRWAALER